MVPLQQHSLLRAALHSLLVLAVLPFFAFFLPHFVAPLVHPVALPQHVAVQAACCTCIVLKVPYMCGTPMFRCGRSTAQHSAACRPLPLLQGAQPVHCSAVLSKGRSTAAPHAQAAPGAASAGRVPQLAGGALSLISPAPLALPPQTAPRSPSPAAAAPSGRASGCSGGEALARQQCQHTVAALLVFVGFWLPTVQQVSPSLAWLHAAAVLPQNCERICSA